jgi:hypothetical protein
MIPVLDTSFKEEVITLRRPIAFKLGPKQLILDETIRVFRRCNELGLRGLRITEISIHEKWDDSGDLEVRLKYEAAR